MAFDHIMTIETEVISCVNRVGLKVYKVDPDLTTEPHAACNTQPRKKNLW